MENVEAIVIVSPLDIFDDDCKHKSSLKSSHSFKSMQRNDSSCIDSEIVEKKRVHFRETIEVFSDGEETVSVPLNDDFTTFPSLRSPLRRLIGRRQRMHQRFIQASEDLYMVGDLYSNVPIIVLKKNIQPASVDLIAPLATMDDMDMFDGFDDDEQSTNDWIDDVDDPNGYYYCGSDDLSAESDSDDVDEVMGMLLREKCLSDEDFGMSSSNDHYESDDGVSVDVVKKEVSVDDFFNEANIEEIESSSSTDSMADSDHFNGMSNFDECRDVTGNLMGIIPEECFHATHEPSNDISSPDFPRPLSESECYKNTNDSYSLKNHSDVVNEINILNTSEVSRISPHLVPSSIHDKVIIDEVKFEDASVGVVRSKSIDFKNSLDSGHMKVNSMMDSGFASLEMADLESKLVSSPNDDGSRRLIRGAPPFDNQMRIEEQDDSLEDKFSCSSDSNVSGSLSNFSPHSFETSDKKTSSNGLHLSKSTDNFLSEKSRLTSNEDESNRETAILSAEENFPQNIHVSTLKKLTMNRSSCYRVELLPMLTWVFCHPQ